MPPFLILCIILHGEQAFLKSMGLLAEERPNSAKRFMHILNYRPDPASVKPTEVFKYQVTLKNFGLDPVSSSVDCPMNFNGITHYA